MKQSTSVGIVVLIIIIAGAVYLYMQQNAGLQPVPAQSTITPGSVVPLPIPPPPPIPPQVLPAGITQSTETTASATTITSGSSTGLGDYLTAPNGMTLYSFKNDTAGVSNCSGTCSTNWPPYTVSSATSIVKNADLGGSLATITRADGTLQVTYNNMPLYFYVKDSKTGDTTGNGVGGLWYVVKP